MVRGDVVRADGREVDVGARDPLRPEDAASARDEAGLAGLPGGEQIAQAAGAAERQYPLVRGPDDEGTRGLVRAEVDEWKEGVNRLRLGTYAELLKVAAEKGYGRAWADTFFRKEQRGGAEEWEPAAPEAVSAAPEAVSAAPTV